MPHVGMIVGPQASGKSTLVDKFPNHVCLSRDQVGGKVESLVPRMIAELSKGNNVVLDNTFPTVYSRAPFIEACKTRKVPIDCAVMGTSIEDCLINALHRMWDRYGQVFFDAEDLKKHPKAKKDSNMFVAAVLFKYRKEFERPSKEEGFASVEKVKFVRKPMPPVYSDKAVLFDYDGTVRVTTEGAQYNFPVKAADVRVLPGRAEVLQRYRDDGYCLLGVSNQSAISRGQAFKEEIEICFMETHHQLGLTPDEYVFCPHLPPKDSCYCRKPQSGIGVYFIRKYTLNPALCIVVGDQTTDKTFAKRLGFEFVHADEFFKGG